MVQAGRHPRVLSARRAPIEEVAVNASCTGSMTRFGQVVVDDEDAATVSSCGSFRASGAGFARVASPRRRHPHMPRGATGRTGSTGRTGRSSSRRLLLLL